MNNKIRLIHNSYFDEDIDDYKIVKVIIDIFDGKRIVNYQYITEDDYEFLDIIAKTFYKLGKNE